MNMRTHIRSGLLGLVFVSLLVSAPLISAYGEEDELPATVEGTIESVDLGGRVLQLRVSGALYVLDPLAEIGWRGGQRLGADSLTPGSRVQLQVRRAGAVRIVERVILVPE
jgi:hypothetical protein